LPIKDNDRKKILKAVAAAYRSQKKELFTPGTSYVNYAGRIYDEKELVSLVDSSLDFWLTAGRYAEKLEISLAKYLNVRFCALVNSGSSANLIAISALTSPLLKEKRLKAGDEVITTACGFPTTLNPILQNGLIPVFVDVELGTYNIDTSLLKKALSKRTKAIFVAHTLGNPVNIAAVSRFAKEHGLWFIEDNGKFTGTYGDIATLSFYPAHHMTMGEGGAVLTSDPILKRIILSMRDWGRDCWCEPGHDDTCHKRFTQKFGKLPYGYDHKYVYSHVGYNLKVTDMQAAIGVAQLEKLPGFIAARKKNFSSLTSHLTSRGYNKYLQLPKATKLSDPSWFGFPILVKDNASFTRADIVGYLEKHKVATRMLFGGNLTKQPAYQGVKYRVAGTLKNTDKVMNSLFWIGVYPGITKDKIKYILKTFDGFFKRVK
jgi:CDP-6-deoxy-D-xylo-4-hexulose-3-dehydrase